MSQDQYNWVYKELVQGPNDVVGALAYVLYKQQKIAFLEKIQADHNRAPTPEELSSFHIYTRLPETLLGFKDRAEALADQFLEVALESKLQEAEALFRQSATIAEIKDAKAGINSTIDSSKQLLETKIDTVITELTGKRGFWGWVADVGGNLAVNFGTIALLGSLISGYNLLGGWNGMVEKISGIGNDASLTKSPPSQTAKEPVASAPQ